jgi:hypothetical protein
VTGGAGTNHCAVIEVCITPGIDSMAVITIIITGNMISVFAGCENVVMALSTIDRCSLESTIHMATGAINKLMLAGKRETRRKVIEAARIFGGDHRLTDNEK